MGDKNMDNKIFGYNEDIRQMMVGVKACEVALRMGVSEHTLISWLNSGGMTNGQKDACIKAINELKGK